MINHPFWGVRIYGNPHRNQKRPYQKTSGSATSKLPVFVADVHPNRSNTWVLFDIANSSNQQKSHREILGFWSLGLTRFAQKNWCKKRLAIFLCQVASARRTKSLPHLENTYTVFMGFYKPMGSPTFAHVCTEQNPALLLSVSSSQLEWTCKRCLV